VLPFPVELLRFLEKSSDALDRQAAQVAEPEPKKPGEQLPG
jgi:hypothetical protein